MTKSETIKICLYCKKEFTGKRSDAKFCRSTCKAKYHVEKIDSEKPQQDECGVLQCHCINANPYSNGLGGHTCLKCNANWYH